MTDCMSTGRTDAIRGIAILGIVLFHILIAWNISPVFNFWGGVLVAVFLMLSGYGLHESFLHRGLEGYWCRRWHKVLLPSITFICLYNLLCTDGNLRTCMDDLLNRKQTYWFLFHLTKCYLIYWLAMTYGGEQRMNLLWSGAIATFALSQLWYHNNLESGQTLSFTFGVWLSAHKARWQAMDSRRGGRCLVTLLLVGLVAYVVKVVPAIHALKPTLAYTPFILTLNFSWGLATLMLLSHMRVERVRVLGLIGRYSLYLYIVHIPMMHYIHDLPSTGAFVGWVLLGMAGCVGYKRYVSGSVALSSMLYVAINGCFVAKYSSRLLPEHYPYVTFAFIVAMTCALKAMRQTYVSRPSTPVWTTTAAMLAFVGMIALQYSIDPLQLRVDRWSALAYPIRNLLHGTYPYSAPTHLGGFASPFPAWQVLHIPFYLLGNVGLSLFAVLVLYVWSIKRQWNAGVANQTAILLSCTVALWYEAAVRSDLMTDMLLTAVVALWIQQRLSVEWLCKHSTAVAVVVALMACTRIITVIPLAMLLMPCITRMPKGKVVGASLIAIGVFVVTFIPFALWDWQSFAHSPFAPWVLQSRQGHLSDFILYIPSMLVLTFLCGRSASCYFRNAGIMLLITTATSLVHRMYVSGNWDLFHSAYDITYLSTALPFLTLSMVLTWEESPRKAADSAK